MAERNALAELEFRIDAAHTEMIASEIPKPYCEYVDMARRIVAELAAVKPYSAPDQNYMAYRDEIQEAYERCRAIAEE